MINVLVTGATGLIGSNIINKLKFTRSNFNVIIVDKSDFTNETLLDAKIHQANFVIHLAAICRNSSQEYLYNHNLFLTNQIINSLKRVNSKAHIIFASSTHETSDSAYGRSKFDSRKLFISWANDNCSNFHGLIIPNTFGPFGKPFHNSVVSTFCHQLVNNEECIISGNNQLKLIYVDDLVQEIVDIIEFNEFSSNEEYIISNNISDIKINDLYTLLNNFKIEYLGLGIIPNFKNKFELQLFNTFRSYINLNNTFPRKYISNVDDRGSFIELIKINSGGQISFSTTKPDITRGNHFHTRKIERFMVLKGKALVQLRKVDEDEVFNFKLEGENPSYVDMPIWYTHNIKNVGSEELLTVFWINEFYDPNDSDTYLMKV